MKDTGFIYEPLQPTDWLFGSSKLGLKVRRPDTNWTLLLPTEEKQRRNDTDKQWCVSASAQNVIETEFRYNINNKIINIEDLQWLNDKGYMDEYGKPDFSDRFTAIVSKTRGNGNSARKVAQAIHEYGLIPEKMLQYRKSMTWKECYGYNKWDTPNKSLITQEFIDLGREFLERFPINYEFVSGGTKAHNKALKYNPLQVFVHAWNGIKNGIYIRTTVGINHAVEKNNTDEIFDTYNPFLKSLAPDFIYLDYAVRYLINFKKEEIIKKKTMTTQQLKKLYELGLKREPNVLAQPYLNHDIEFVIDELLKSKEHESISKWVNFLRSVGFSLGKSK